MRPAFSSILSNRSYFLLLLPIFFVLHGYLENHQIVFASDALKLAGWYILAAIILAGLSWLYYRNRDKAVLASFILLSFNFFFGAFHDLLKKTGSISFLAKYSVLLPIVLVVLIFILIGLKKYKKDLGRIKLYLNFLFVVLVLIDSLLLVIALNRDSRAGITTDTGLTPCPDCPRPDIYLIVADSYPGKIELQEKLMYDNSAFENELRKRGFYVGDSTNANYYSTPISIASLLNMNYIEGIQLKKNTAREDVAVAYQVLRNCQVQQYLEQIGYDVHNFSIFDLEGEAGITKPTFLPGRTSTITSQTFVTRIITDLGFHLIDDLHLDFMIRYIRNTDLKNNQKVVQRTLKIAGEQRKNPKFVYTHVVMPHYPYYFDSTGLQYPVRTLDEKFIVDTNAFISYLKYSNKKYLELVDHILKNSPNPPLIILLGDHGFREFPEPVEEKYYFMNLLAVHYPDGDYEDFYRGMSNVNLFRIILNDRFRQSLSLLKDSTVYMSD